MDFKIVKSFLRTICELIIYFSKKCKQIKLNEFKLNYKKHQKYQQIK